MDDRLVDDGLWVEDRLVDDGLWVEDWGMEENRLGLDEDYWGSSSKSLALSESFAASSSQGNEDSKKEGGGKLPRKMELMSTRTKCKMRVPTTENSERIFFFSKCNANIDWNSVERFMVSLTILLQRRMVNGNVILRMLGSWYIFKLHTAVEFCILLLQFYEYLKKN